MSWQITLSWYFVSLQDITICTICLLHELCVPVRIKAGQCKLYGINAVAASEIDSGCVSSVSPEHEQ